MMRNKKLETDEKRLMDAAFALAKAYGPIPILPGVNGYANADWIYRILRRYHTAKRSAARPRKRK